MKKNVIKYVEVYFLLIIIFVLILVITSTFSSQKIANNVKESSETLLEEGNRKIIYIPYRDVKMQFDNYTDALMINTAFSIDSKTPLYSVLVARKNYIPDMTTEVYEDSAGELKSASKYKYHNEVGELNDLANGEIAESFEYARYWHGYLIVLRPLLVLFNIVQIRVLLTTLLILLAIILLYLIAKRKNITIAVIFFTGLLGIEYFYLGFSLQGIFVFLITLIASIFLLIKYRTIKNFGLFFFMIGILTNFFDFLTVPLVTLAIPLIIYFLLKDDKEKNNEKVILKNILKYSSIWIIGYAMTWFTKWALVDVVLKKNLIATSIQQVFYRSKGIEQFNIFNVININIEYIYVPLFISLFLTFMLINLKLYLNKKNTILNKNVNINGLLIKILPYVIISLMPFVWYIVLQNHSYYHAFFTYRNLIITNISINLCIEETMTHYFKDEELNEK